MTHPTVSVILLTYNHERYIADAIKGILKQDCLDKIEIIWHDDCSTDKTQFIANQCLENFAVKKILRENNRFQRNIPFWLDIIESCRGDYIALIEGDDLWIDSKKITKQLFFLNKFNEINISFTKAKVINYDGIELENTLAEYGDQLSIANISDVIRGDGGFMPTASILVRKSALINAPSWFYEHQPVGDYMIQALGSLANGALYIPEYTCKYRSGDPTSWTQSTIKDPLKFLYFENRFINLLIQMRKTFPTNNEIDFDFIINKHLRILINHSFEYRNFSDLIQVTQLLDNNFRS